MSVAEASNAFGLWLNGEPAEKIDLNDRSIQYGDGFFTTILVGREQVYNWPAHWRRIEVSSRRLGMGAVDENTVKSWLYRALSDYFTEESEKNCVAKLVFTRGVGGRGYSAPDQPHLNCLIYLKPTPNNVYATSNSLPLKAGISSVQAAITPLAGLKTLNRLENVLARTDVGQGGLDEAIMLNHLQQVVCGTQSNIYLVNQQSLVTPKLDLSGVEGTSRFQLNRLLQESECYKLEERVISIEELHQAEELFFINAVRGVQPVGQFCGKPYSIERSLDIRKLWDDWQVSHQVHLSEFRG